jgi:hypothetical protein
MLSVNRVASLQKITNSTSRTTSKSPALIRLQTLSEPSFRAPHLINNINVEEHAQAKKVLV